ncbi:MAG: low molecular weight phosphotyrosine protein phosphatase [Cyclobacteriaceae bacterium]|nr:low molecular weight phosphotyrosine protein phosphatase [Cyclobacteriaceae bacterium]
MTRILFVCLGNICRSPLAEAIFIHQITEKNLQNHFKIASCGTANYHVGDQPDSRTIRNALKNGIKIDHIGRQFSVKDFEDYDLIIPMDQSNLNNIMRLPGAEKYGDKIKLMRTFDSEDIGSDVPDPWSGGESDFQNVFEILTRSMKGFISTLK